MAALVGAGWQLIVLSFGVILFAAATGDEKVCEGRDDTLRAMLLGYCWTSPIAGYASSRLFQRYAGASVTTRACKCGGSIYSKIAWWTAIILTVFLLPMVATAIVATQHAALLSYGTNNFFTPRD